MTPGFKTSEFAVLVATLLCSVLPLVLDKLPPGSQWAAVLGALLAAASYIAGRSWVKAADSKAQAIAAAAGAAVKPSDPPQG